MTSSAGDSSPENVPASCPASLPGHHEHCPLCGGDNGCRVAKGHLYKGACWCQEIIVPAPILHRLAEEWTDDPACLCRPCLETIARVARERDGAAAILAEVRQQVAARQTQSLSSEDSYLEDGKVVFTAAYHLRRGSCCGSGCRHCPY